LHTVTRCFLHYRSRAGEAGLPKQVATSLRQRISSRRTAIRPASHDVIVTVFFLLIHATVIDPELRG